MNQVMAALNPQDQPAPAGEPVSSVPPEAPPPEFPAQVIPAGPPAGGRFPVRKILLGLAALLLVGVAVFAGRILLGKVRGPAGPSQVSLTWWGLWEDASLVNPILEDYQTKNPGVRITYIKQAKEDYRERLVSSFARGDAPDIFRFHNSWVPMLAGNLAPLPAQVMDAATFEQTFYPAASVTLRSGANLVGLPLMFEGLGLFINEDLFEAAGKSEPATWDELRRTALDLTVRDAQGRLLQAGVALGRTENIDHWQDILALMMLQNGVDLASPTGRLAEDALSFFTVFATRDRVWDETLPSSTQAFAAGKLAMYFGPSWRAHEIKKLNPQLRFRAAPVPQLPKDNPQEPDLTWASFWAEGVWAKSKNAPEAWKFLAFLTSRGALQEMYQEAAKTRLFGEPYPRVDMASLLLDDPVVGAFISQAPAAQSWYLASRTFDGPTGINSRISAYFEDAVNAVVTQGRAPSGVLPTLAQGVGEVLTSYNVTK